MKIKKRMRIFCAAAALLTLAIAPVSLHAATEEIVLPDAVWSGYWWPISKGELVQPLKKYDKITGKKAAAWEKKNNPSGADVPSWYGYCHAWAASSIMEQEPKQPRRAGRQTLSVGDQKGLLAASHASDISNTYGARYNSSDDDPDDIAPDELWMVLRRYLKEQKQPIVFDIAAGGEVWNYPVYAYRVTYNPVNGEVSPCTLEVWLADDAVGKDFVGLKKTYKKYTFEVRFRNGSVVLGTGKWTGSSKKDHPDFAWSPYVVRPENPEISYGQVCDILGTTPATGTEQPVSVAAEEETETPADETDTDSGAAEVTETGTDTGTTEVTETEIEVVSVTTAPDEAESETESDADAESGISADRLFELCSNKPSAWTFDVTVDKLDGGEYAVGDTIAVTGKSAEAGYLYLYVIDPNDNVSLFYPKPGIDNHIDAGEFAVPGPDSNFLFRLTEPTGTYRIRAILCENRIDLARSGAVSVKTKSGKTDLTLTSGLADQARKSLSEMINKPAAPAETKGAAGKPEDETGDSKVSIGRFAQDQVVFGILYPAPVKDKE